MERKAKKKIVVSKELPYPPINMKDLKEGQYRKFVTFFNNLQVTIPFFEALQKISTYAKIIKELLTKKIKCLNNEMVNLLEWFSAIILRKFSSKQLDLRRFNITFTIVQLIFHGELCDLEESIPIISLSMMRRLGGKAKGTNMTLTLENKSFLVPHGILDVVLVKVGHLSIHYIL